MHHSTLPEQLRHCFIPILEKNSRCDFKNFSDNLASLFSKFESLRLLADGILERLYACRKHTDSVWFKSKHNLSCCCNWLRKLSRYYGIRIIRLHMLDTDGMHIEHMLQMRQFCISSLMYFFSCSCAPFWPCGEILKFFF